MHDSDDGREAQAWCALRNDDARLAFRLFLRLAMEGSANAQRQVAEMFFYGTGVREDEPLAARWYRTAAEQGHAEAQCDYAWCLDQGLGVVRDRQQATMWLRRSAQQGNRSAQYALGIAYERGQCGVPRDLRRSVHWYHGSPRRRTTRRPGPASPSWPGRWRRRRDRMMAAAGLGGRPLPRRARGGGRPRACPRPIRAAAPAGPRPAS